MARNQTVSIGIAVNGKQAEMQAKALVREIDRLTESLGKMQAKLADESTWGTDETADTIKREIKKLDSDLKTAKRLHKNVVTSIKGVDDVLVDLSHANYNELTRTRSLLQSSVKSLDPATQKYQDKVKQLNSLKKEIETRSTEINSGLTGKSLEKVLGNVKGSSLSDLEQSAKMLEQQIARVGTRTQEYITKSAKLREVNKQIDSIKANFKEKENIIVRTGKRLASYVAVYAGFNEVVGQLRRVVQANLELSDSLADIQKTTGLTEKQVAGLSDEINKIDTRTATQQLHELAYEAGKLGISAEEDVLAFVKAGNQLVVALGEDLGGSQAIRELMKVNAILGTTENLGMERSLLATGSAINEISQTSRASAGPIADIVSRIGAIGAAAKLQMPDLIALAGTADAMGQSAEVAGTAFNKFITTLQMNPVDVAYALGLDPQRLQDLMGAGNTMQAIVEVFERLNEMGDLSSLGGVFKDLGSEGARMSQVLATMAAGVDELKAQVFTSNKAFQDATSVTNEYNIKNESAAAILERMGNAIREKVTHSGFVEWIRDVLHWLYYLPQRIEENRLALWSLNAIMITIATTTAVKLTKAIGASLLDAFTALGGRIDLATNKFKMFYIAAAKTTVAVNATTKTAVLRAIATTGAIGKLRIAVVALGKALWANPIFLISGVLATAGIAFMTFRKRIDETVQASAELETAVQNEQYAMRKLMSDINNANGATGERASLIKQLNDKYGNYLGFLVTESNYLENQAYIYDLLNAKIRESITLKMNEKMMDDIAEKNAGKRTEANRDILSGLYDMPSIGEAKAPEYMEKVMSAVLEQVKNGTKDVNKVMEAAFGDTYKAYLNEKKKLDDAYNRGKLVQDAYTSSLIDLQENTFGSNYDDLLVGIRDMLQVETKIQQEVDSAQAIIDATNKNMQKRSEEITKAHLDKQYASVGSDTDIKTLQTLKEQTESYIKTLRNSTAGLIQQKEALQGLSYAEEEEYGRLSKLMQSSVKPSDEDIDRWDELNEKKNKTVKLSEEDEKTIADTNAEIQRMEKNLQGVNKELLKQKDFNIWGTANEKELAENSPKQLVAMYQKLEADASRLSDQSFKTIGEFQEKNGKLMATQFWKNFDTRKEATAWYQNQKDAIAAQLKKLGYNTSGHFIGASGDGSGESEARKQYKGWLSALEAYYNERETIIRREGMAQGKLESEISREIENLKLEKLNDQIELEEALLQDHYQNSKFNPKKYVGKITGTDYFAGFDPEEALNIVKQGGPKLDAEIRKSMTNSMATVEERLYKMKQRIEQILMEDDFTGKVADEYLESIDQLGLLFNIETESQTKHTEEEGERRLAIMREWAKQSYSINRQGLEKLVAENDLFSQWRIGRTQADYEALLLMLRKFNDDSIEAEKKAADRRKKIFDQKWNTKDPETGKSQADIQEERITGEEADLKMYESAKELGLASQRRVDDAQIAVYEARIAASQAYIEQIKKEMEVEMWKAQNEIMQAEQVLARKRALGVDTTQAEADVTAAKQNFESLKRQSEQMTLDEQQNIREQQRLIAETEDSITQRKMETLKGYTDAVVSFGEQMGEAAFGEVEDRKEAAKQLLKTTLQLTKDLIMAEMKRLIMKKALGQQEVVQEQAKEQTITLTKGEHDIARINSDTATAQGENAINTSRAGGKTLAELGWWGIPLLAVISAALSALMNAALSAATKAKSEVSSATGASSGRLATGMLTYAEGNYPVLGNDGQVYNAKYEGSNIQTGIYRGGAHFGIFSEKKPEAIIDGDTTQRLIMNHPDIWKAIVTLSKTGRLERAGMRTFATGNIDQLAKQATGADAQNTASANDAQIEMLAEMRMLMTANLQVMNRLATEGVQSNINMYGENGLYKNMEKARKFANSRGYK